MNSRPGQPRVADPGLNKDFGTDVLVSAATRHLLDDGVFDLTPLPAAQVKGKSVQVEVYALAEEHLDTRIAPSLPKGISPGQKDDRREAIPTTRCYHRASRHLRIDAMA